MKDNLQSQAFNLKEEGRIYLDHNATTPLAADLIPQIQSWLTHWGNPSSIHHSGRGPKLIVREARQKLSKALGAGPLELIFTSGGSESNNTAIKGLYREVTSKDPSRKEVIVSSVEHPSVMKTAEHLEAQGVLVHRIPVSREGQLDEDFYVSVLSKKTALVSVMLANNETGHIFPVKELCQKAHAEGAMFHTDAVQALGKLSVDLHGLGVDMASFSGHKFYSLKGCGLLYSKKGTKFTPLLHGGSQERARRAGTENTLSIAALGFVSDFLSDLPAKQAEIKKLRDHMEKEILNRISGVTITGPKLERLPNASSLCIEGVDGESLLMSLDLEGFSVSTGAACSSGSPEPSPVLLAMGLSRKEAQSSLRLGLGWGTTAQEVERFLDILCGVVERLRKIKSQELAYQEAKRDVR